MYALVRVKGCLVLMPCADRRFSGSSWRTVATRSPFPGLRHKYTNRRFGEKIRWHPYGLPARSDFQNSQNLTLSLSSTFVILRFLLRA